MHRLWPSVVAVIGVGLFGVLRLNDLPTEMVTHWNLQGAADGTSSRAWGVFLLPGVALATALLLAVVPRIDPLRRNFDQHADAYWLLANTVVVFLAFLHLAVLGSNLGWPVPMGQAIGCGAGALLLVLGNYLSRIRQNWFLGIRTPWTLSSEKSWRETHRLGGKLFVAGGLLLIVTTLLTATLPMWALIVGVGAPSLALVVYSYVIWSRDPAAQGRTQ